MTASSTSTQSDERTSKRVLLLGARGMLGRTFAEAFDTAGRAYSGLDVSDVDITDAASVAGLPFASHPLIINCAAFTDVDGAEKNEELATRVNGQGVGLLAAACRAAGATLVHFSTDYVFAGNATSPYAVDAPRDPVNAYGRSKALGEQLLEESGAEHLLLRTSWLYAPWGKNFVTTMLRLGKERELVQVVNDQRGRPTSCHGLVHTTLALLNKGARGTLHATDGGECTWYEFTREIFEQSGATARLEPCTSEAFVRPAKRPAYSVLDLTPTEAYLGPLPDWKERLRSVINRVSQTPSS